MKTRTMLRSISVLVFFGVVALLSCAGAAPAQTALKLQPRPGFDFGGSTKSLAQPDQVWQYRLLPESQLQDDCLFCGRPTIFVPMRGTFHLRLLRENPLFSTYAVEDISFDAGSSPGATYQVRGKGTYQVGGEVALRQEMFLEVQVDDGRTNQLCYFTNAAPTVDRLWPMLHLTLNQTNGTLFQTFQLQINAAPLREIWFSTAHGFTPGVQPPYTNYVTVGDLVSSAGRVVKRNHELTARLGFMPGVPDLGLDAVDLRPGGEVAFSIETDWFSEMLGQLREGDVLSDRGRVLTNYAGLIGAFSPELPPMDPGLDALQVLGSGEVYFSVEREFFSRTLRRTIRRGDLLSSAGRIVKTNEQLLARFQPADPKKDYGLDAIYVWPSGEVWFSVETGFYGQHFEPYGHGDLLSDQGYVVSRNLDLLAPFQPLEDLADFGLDALWLVTDVVPPDATIAAPRCASITLNRATGNVSFQWEGTGRVFQIERATNVLGPWLPLSPVLIEPPRLDAGARTNSPQGFYRLRQW